MAAFTAIDDYGKRAIQRARDIVPREIMRAFAEELRDVARTEEAASYERIAVLPGKSPRVQGTVSGMCANKLHAYYLTFHVVLSLVASKHVHETDDSDLDLDACVYVLVSCLHQCAERNDLKLAKWTHGHPICRLANVARFGSVDLEGYLRDAVVFHSICALCSARDDSSDVEFVQGLMEKLGSSANGRKIDAFYNLPALKKKLVAAGGVEATLSAMVDGMRVHLEEGAAERAANHRKRTRTETETEPANNNDKKSDEGDPREVPRAAARALGDLMREVSIKSYMRKQGLRDLEAAVESGLARDAPKTPYNLVCLLNKIVDMHVMAS